MKDIANTLDVRGALRDAMGRLHEAHVPSHTLAAELLLMRVLDCERAWLYAYPEHLMDAASVERYFDLVARRIAGVPTQYLTGRQEFWGLEFEVTMDVLIPRPETEHVVEVALERLGQATLGGVLGQRAKEFGFRRSADGKMLRIADVGTGSGCLAVALARELPRATVFATDAALAALVVAQRNAVRHGVSSRVHFVHCNLLDAFLHGPRVAGHGSRGFDLIVSNPPYVGHREANLLQREVREHEPHEALFAGEQGFELYAPLIAQAEKLLVRGGILVVELSYNALDVVRPLLGPPTWTSVSATNDLAGILRVIAAERA